MPALVSKDWAVSVTVETMGQEVTPDWQKCISRPARAVDWSVAGPGEGTQVEDSSFLDADGL